MKHQVLTQRHLDARILIADDAEFNLVLLTDILNQAGFTRIFHAADGLEALKVTKEQSIDLIILDIVMPNMDGFGFCQAMLENDNKKHIPILVQTALHDINERLEILNAGAHDMLTKPINPKELLLRIALHLDHAFSVNDLEKYKQVMEEELALTQKIQHALMPDREDAKMLHSRWGYTITSHYKPSLKIGGDLWGIRHINDTRIAFFAFDIAGHGISAAVHAFQLHTLINLKALIDLTPGEYMAELNTRMTQIFKPGQFAVCFIGVIDKATGNLSYASSGFTAPVLYRSNIQSTALLSNAGVPLGISQHAVYETHHTEFSANDSLFLYSDALTETPLKQNQASMLSEYAICETLRKHLSADNAIDAQHAAIIRDLVEAIGADEENHAPMDDLMLVFISQNES